MKFFDWISKFFNSDSPPICKIVMIAIFFIITNLAVVALLILLFSVKPSSNQKQSSEEANYVPSQDVSETYVETEMTDTTTTTTVSTSTIKRTTFIKGVPKTQRSTIISPPYTNSEGNNNEN